MSASAKANWIAVDWGTSHLRVAAINTDGSVHKWRRSDRGMGKLNPSEFEPALMDLISDWLSDTQRTDVICCGMVGARQGWLETPYRSSPCQPIAETAGTRIDTKNPRINVSVVPGIKQAHPPDVMRGEETQIAGLLALQPKFDGVVCLPGTHSKWVHVSAGEIVSFATYMTGEVFALLAKQSVLRHSIAHEGWDNDSFLTALDDAIAKPKMFAARLFSLRAENLVADLSPEIARSRLSGFLIGLELAASRPYWLGNNVALCGASAVSRAYEQALVAQGLKPIILDTDQVTIAGLGVARVRLVGKKGPK